VPLKPLPTAFVQTTHEVFGEQGDAWLQEVPSLLARLARRLVILADELGYDRDRPGDWVLPAPRCRLVGVSRATAVAGSPLSSRAEILLRLQACEARKTGPRRRPHAPCWAWKTPGQGRTSDTSRGASGAKCPGDSSRGRSATRRSRSTRCYRSVGRGRCSCTPSRRASQQPR
jgi:hypothetical protein